jgi:hypothetical protein
MTAVQGIKNKNRRVEVMVAIAPDLTKFPLSVLYFLWRETLHLFADHSREDLLKNLPAFSPVLIKLGGAEAVAETARAIQDVGRWWP